MEDDGAGRSRATGSRVRGRSVLSRSGHTGGGGRNHHGPHCSHCRFHHLDHRRGSRRDHRRHYPSHLIPDTTMAVEPVVVPPPDLVTTDEPVADVAERLVPSVVHLEVQSEDVFEQGAGSGVIFDSNGYILTAAHVVETVVSGEAELTVRLSNGDRMPGEVVGTDADSDVAVVKVERTGLVPAELALEDQPRAGQLVVAVGSPWGLESSVTSGVISAVDRIVEGKLLHQSDAVLYPGNSGAPWPTATVA